jgi:hypothetical protein
MRAPALSNNSNLQRLHRVYSERVHRRKKLELDEDAMKRSYITICLASLFLQASAQSTGSWPFAYPDDTKPGSLLDLRSMNEKTAGQTGYIHLSGDGRSFVKGDGTAIRFWPVCGYGYRLKPDEMKAEARFFAKMGINMVRIHGSVSPKGKGKPITGYDADEIDHIQQYVAALKAEGIYVTISPFWANGGHSGAESSWNLGYGDGEDIWGLLFFDDSLRAAYKGWIKHLYLDNNPYTGIPLAKDPSVAIVQIQNEDGLFFWTFQGIKPAQKKALGKKFGAWLVKKYGSIGAVQTQWQGASQAGDDWNAATPAMLDSWVLTQPQTGSAKTRADDQTAFMIDQQRGFYSDITNFIHKDLGYMGLVNCSNWITADPVKMNDLERYTYTVADVEAVNRYYTGGLHKGPNDGWRIDEGDFLSDVSGLLDPRSLPFNIKQVVGHPTVITESGWVHPLSYQAEGPLLAAAYQSLTGMQGLYWFALGAKNYEVDSSIGFVTTPDGSHPLGEWSDAVPQMLGQFPASAILFRMGYVKQGPVVVHEERTRESLDSREIPVIAEDPSFDPNHNGSDARAGSNQAKGADPLAFLVGTVEEKFDGNPLKTQVMDLSRYIDSSRKMVKSATGQLSLDYGRGLFTLDAPKAQAVAGFLNKSGGVFQTSDLTINSTCDYATITVVPLDDKPINASEKILVQIGTVVKPTGWKQEPSTYTQDKKTVSGWKVVNSGKMPWQVQNTVIKLAVRNSMLKKGIVLDPAGYPVREIAGKIENGQFVIHLPQDAMYIVLE